MLPSPSGAAPRRARRRPSPSVSVVIPVRDAAGLALTLRGLPPVDEVVVVTTGGRYADAAVRASCPSAVLVRQTRSGIGNALACGLAASRGDVVVALDGSGAADPSALPRYVSAVADGADVAFGSRYRPGGRDLTAAGPFGRLLDVLLVWLVNVLFGGRRTDPGFGFTAFRRAAIARLDLPDPARGGPPGWGDGPEFAALVTVRSAVRGLAVAEVADVAYPRLNEDGRAGWARLAHWARTIVTEYPGRADGSARHATGAAPVGRTGFPGARPRPMVAAATGEPRGTRTAGTLVGAPARAGQPTWDEPPSRRTAVRDPWHSDVVNTVDGSRPSPPYASRHGGRDVKPADEGSGRWEVPGGRSTRRDTAGFWPPPRARRPEAGWSAPSRAHADTSTGRERDARTGRATHRRERTDPPAPRWAADEPWQHGAMQRPRVDENRQPRPDLRVINGEGIGSGRTRSGRLRPVPGEEFGR